VVADEFSALGVERMQWGVRAFVGYRWDGCAVEAGGFYLPQASTTQGVTIPGGVALPFFNFPASVGDGLFSLAHTDALIQNFQTTLGSAEVNFRCQPVAGYGLELLGGARYLDLQERYTLVDNFAGLSRPPTVPVDILSYTVRTQNRLVGGQFGIDWEHPLWRWLAFGFNAKGAWGANFLDSQVAMDRGDGLHRFRSRSKTQFGQVYEAGLFLDWYPCDRARVRGGYNVLWVVDVAEAVSQVNFDLAQPIGRPTDNGSVFYHGPVIELHFLF
jgi:hypothetical protein